MKVSINERLLNKNERNDRRAMARGFAARDLTPQQLADSINAGFAFSFQFKDGHRSADKFICSDVIAADIDEGMTLEEAAADPFIQSYGTILYKTPSHTDEHHRFRIVFRLPETISDADRLRFVQRGLARKLRSDPAATDAARVFYGSRDSNPTLIGHTLTEQQVEEFEQLGRAPHDVPDRADRSGRATTRSILTLDDNSTVRIKGGGTRLLSELPARTSVYCPFHQDRNPSAFTVASRSGSIGVHCSACQQTFWIEHSKPSDYDFYWFDSLVRRLRDEFVPNIEVENEFISYEQPKPYIVTNERYLGYYPPKPGIMLIKSPKGTGKTHYLKNFLLECQKKHWKVLLVGHRQTLIRATAQRIGLDCYLESVRGADQRRLVTKRFAISVDSLASLLNPMQHKFDCILIDESEQVFSHLTSETIDPTRRRKCYHLLGHYIGAAKCVVAMDADLNRVTFDAIDRFGFKGRLSLSDKTMILNEYKPQKRSFELYASKHHLIGDIMEAIRSEQRCFICCNAKSTVDDLTQQIRAQYGESFPIMSITSENSSEKGVVKFIKDIKREIINYKVVIVSPAIGTGIDITFDDGVQHVDAVFGLFGARINTHYDIDQQLSRVRDPKTVKVWVSPETFWFETEVEPIKIDLAESGEVPHVLKGYSLSGTAKYDLDDPYLNLHASIVAAQRASKNNLRKNFIELRRYNGWDVVEVAKDADLSALGSETAKRGRQLSDDARIAALMAARILDQDTYDELKQQLATKGRHDSDNDRFAMERFELESFYRAPATPDLIRNDRHGKLRACVKTLESLLVSERRGEMMINVSIAASASGRRSAKSEQEMLIELLRECGLVHNDGRFDLERIVTVDSLAGFVRYCRNNRLKIERMFDIDLRDDLAGKPTTQLNRFLAQIGMKVSLAGKAKRGTKATYQYRLDRPAYEAMRALVTARSQPQGETTPGTPCVRADPETV